MFTKKVVQQGAKILVHNAPDTLQESTNINLSKITAIPEFLESITESGEIEQIQHVFLNGTPSQNCNALP
jgi:hypothetical protein